MKHIGWFSILLAVLFAPVGALSGSLCQCEPVMEPSHHCCTASETTAPSHPCTFCSCDIGQAVSHAILPRHDHRTTPIDRTEGFFTPDNHYELIAAQPLTTPPKFQI